MFGNLQMVLSAPFFGSTIHDSLHCTDQTSSRARTSRISKSPPLHNDESPRSFAIIRKWLAICLIDHTKPRIDKCGKIIANTICSIPSATKSRLPIRVLDVGSCPSDSVKLVITQNELGDSFCFELLLGAYIGYYLANNPFNSP